jgi:hypothetical protein
MGKIISFPGGGLAPPPPNMAAPPASGADGDGEEQEVWVVLGGRGHGLRLTTLATHLRENFSEWSSSCAGGEGVWCLLSVCPSHESACYFLKALSMQRK